MSYESIKGSELYEFMTHFDYIREAGTAGESTASTTLTTILKDLGASPTTETFRIPTHTMDETRFTVLEPFEKTYPVGGYYDCGSTPEEGITASFLYIEDGDDLALSNAKGKIVLLNQPVRPPMYQKLIAAGAAAFLTVTGTPIDTGVDKIPSHRELRCKGETPLQGGVLHFADATELVEKGASKAFFKLRQHTGFAVSKNILVTIPGTDPVLSKEHISVTAHHDSVPQGKGAYDNMAGCAIVYGLLQYFHAHPAKRTIDFIWFGAEERGLLGSKAYANRHEKELLSHRINLNVDLAGQLLGSTVFGVTADKKVDEVILRIAKENGRGIVTKNQVWSSDSNSFAAKGVPAVTLDRDGFGMHTRHDTLEYISPWSLERDARLLCAIAETLGNADPFPFARTMPKEYQDILNGLAPAKKADPPDPTGSLKPDPTGSAAPAPKKAASPWSAAISRHTTGEFAKIDKGYVRHCGPTAVTNLLLTLDNKKRRPRLYGITPNQLFHEVATLGKHLFAYYNMNLWIFGGTTMVLTDLYLRTALNKYGIKDVTVTPHLFGSAKAQQQNLIRALDDGNLIYLQLLKDKKYGSHHLLAFGHETVKTDKGTKTMLLLSDGWSRNVVKVPLEDLRRISFWAIHEKQEGTQ